MVDTFVITERKQMVIDLKKAKGIENQKAQVVFVVDRSGSMKWLYENGMVQKTVERVLPIGLAFDDNNEVDCYIFHSGQKRMKETITLKNLATYVQKNITQDYGSTSYAPIINQIVKDYTTKGLFNSKITTLDLPVYVIFLTDGENDDKASTEMALREASKSGIFFQFVGIGNESFRFLTKLDDLTGRVIDNANFFKVPDLDRTSDSELYKLLMEEFPGYIPQAKAKNLIK